MKKIIISIVLIGGFNYCLINLKDPCLDQNEIQTLKLKLEECFNKMYYIIKYEDSFVFSGTGTDSIYDVYLFNNNYLFNKDYDYDELIKLSNTKIIEEIKIMDIT